jgi:mannose-6-phosphate isomerase
MTLELPPTTDKNEIFTAVSEYLGELSLGVVETDFDRPWGGFFVIDPADTAEFIDTYFPDLPKEDIEKGGGLQPKILVVEPGKRLSWQDHERREELWRTVAGPVGFHESETDEQGPLQTLEVSEIVQHGIQHRHRLVGLENWGVVAEIWQHTDPNNPSDEDDIRRVQDDFKRN